MLQQVVGGLLYQNVALVLAQTTNVMRVVDDILLGTVFLKLELKLRFEIISQILHFQIDGIRSLQQPILGLPPAVSEAEADPGRLLK